MTSNLGYLLTEFFLHYGFKFNWFTVGLSSNLNSPFFHKLVRSWYYVGSPYCTAIEDPTDFGNNVGKSIRGLPYIRQAFQFAYYRLIGQHRSLTEISPTLLSTIISTNDLFTNRFNNPNEINLDIEENLSLEPKNQNRTKIDLTNSTPSGSESEISQESEESYESEESEEYEEFEESVRPRRGARRARATANFIPVKVPNTTRKNKRHKKRRK